MKKTLIFLVIVAVAFFLINRYGENINKVLKPIITQIENTIAPPAPCTQPILYSIGSFDTRFGITRTQFQKDITQAATVWNNAHGTSLLAYDEESKLKINLSFDYRQQATVQLDKIDSVIRSDRATYDALKAQYDILSAQYVRDKAALQIKLDAYNQAIAAYNQSVNTWNTRGGAPKPEYEKMQQQKQSLAAQADSLNQDRNTFNQLTEKLNAMIPELNTLVKKLNLNVKEYNTVGATTGEQFNEGEFVVDSEGRRINIYQFENESQLIRVLEHEFGHALGLEHVEDPKAIMYYLNKGTNEKLTASDTAELDRICGAK